MVSTRALNDSNTTTGERHLVGCDSEVRSLSVDSGWHPLDSVGSPSDPGVLDFFKATRSSSDEVLRPWDCESSNSAPPVAPTPRNPFLLLRRMKPKSGLSAARRPCRAPPERRAASIPATLEGWDFFVLMRSKTSALMYDGAARIYIPAGPTHHRVRQDQHARLQGRTVHISPTETVTRAVMEHNDASKGAKHSDLLNCLNCNESSSLAALFARATIQYS
ncbi:hypothetical protein K488DRAFT_73084 [Vararia minispora EC-137]|uniref:Uncharacterized protein n=1 Tax=Vararia minispora EC-137 TaxID=1314806 RepID=A0ACB8QC94_9AGAM|nr:hypothetical protein K488DRAFT_73084 [Vararia minispora EC-137]